MLEIRSLSLVFARSERAPPFLHREGKSGALISYWQSPGGAGRAVASGEVGGTGQHGTPKSSVIGTTFTECPE